MRHHAKVIQPTQRSDRRVGWTIGSDDYEEVVGSLEGCEVLQSELGIGVDDPKITVPLLVLGVLGSLSLEHRSWILILRANEDQYPIRARITQGSIMSGLLSVDIHSRLGLSGFSSTLEGRSRLVRINQVRRRVTLHV
jgi:hypothetical protein